MRCRSSLGIVSGHGEEAFQQFEPCHGFENLTLVLSTNLPNVHQCSRVYCIFHPPLGNPQTLQYSQTLLPSRLTSITLCLAPFIISTAFDCTGTSISAYPQDADNHDTGNERVETCGAFREAILLLPQMENARAYGLWIHRDAIATMRIAIVCIRAFVIFVLCLSGP